MDWLRKLYTPAVTLGAAPVALAMLFKERGRRRLGERFGVWNLDLAGCLWFHGASLGEMNGLVPLMQEAKRRYPAVPILATATSVTGLDRAAAVADQVRLLPFDSPIFLKRALKRVAPKAFIFSETELWPELIDLLAERAIPSYLVNARISDYSFGNYLRFRGLFAPVLTKLSGIFASSAISARRFVALGAPEEKVKVLGNAKYDMSPSGVTEEERASLRAGLCSKDGPVLVLGSLRPGEEVIWFPVIKEILNQVPSLNVIVAPRHKEKFEFFAELLSKYGISYRRRSSKEKGDAATVLLDTMGELSKVYSFADASFVGGTLADFGGHNPLEPAMYGSCVAVGTYVKNVTDIVEALSEARGVVQVSSKEDLFAFVQKVACKDPSIAQLGANARSVWQQFCGATNRIMEAIRF